MDGILRIYSNGSALLNKMAKMPIYGLFVLKFYGPVNPMRSCLDF